MYQTKGNNPPRLDFWEWMIYVLFAGTSFLIGLVVYCVGKSFAWPVRRLMDRVRGEKVETDEKTEEVVQVAPMATPKINSAKAPVVDWDEPEVVESEIRRIELKKGYVVFRFHEQSGTVKGKLTVTSKALHKAIGKTVLLNLKQCKSLADATNIMRAKAEAIFAAATENKATASKVAKAPLVPELLEAGIPDSTEMPIMEDMSFADMPHDMPAFFSDEEYASMERDTGDPYEQFAPPAAPVVADQPKWKKPRGKREFEVKYRGTLVSYGLEPRVLEDPKKGKREIQHFCVRIHDDELQAEHPLWGNDLQRVITESNVQVGERVELGFVGWTTVMVHGKSERKKLWAVSKI